MGSRKRTIAVLCGGLFVGVVIGGYLFSGVQPRSFLALNHCDRCWELKDVLGLMTAVGIAKSPELIPDVVKETDRTIAVKHPFPQARFHVVILPKKDIKDIAHIAPEDEVYVLDALRVAQELVKENNLENYRLITNGPGYQSVRYLHFHLISR